MASDAWAVYSYCLWLYGCATTGAHEWQGRKMQFNLDDVTQRKVNFHFFSVSSFFILSLGVKKCTSISFRRKREIS